MTRSKFAVAAALSSATLMIVGGSLAEAATCKLLSAGLAAPTASVPASTLIVDMTLPGAGEKAAAASAQHAGNQAIVAGRPDGPSTMGVTVSSARPEGSAGAAGVVVSAARPEGNLGTAGVTVSAARPEGNVGTSGVTVSAARPEGNTGTNGVVVSAARPEGLAGTAGVVSAPRTDPASSENDGGIIVRVAGNASCNLRVILVPVN